jgi:CheY-like chemotaxis protein
MPEAVHVMPDETSHAAATAPLAYVVDDEEMLIELAQCVLEQEGFRYLSFVNPQKALDTFTAAAEKPSLLITDYAMAPLNGLELIDACRKLKPELKAAVISGSVKDSVLTQTHVKIDRYLRKPYQLDELAELIRSLRDS